MLESFATKERSRQNRTRNRIESNTAMASPQQVKKYLAHWFQLGKPVRFGRGGEARLPQSVVSGDRYSQEFERCWEEILSPASGSCYLEGTDYTIDELLSDTWQMSECCRCTMPVPLPVSQAGSETLLCPCADLDNWPDLDLPAPRTPVDSRLHLQRIRNRVEQRPDLASLPNPSPHQHSFHRH